MRRDEIRSELFKYVNAVILMERRDFFHRQDVADYFENRVSAYDLSPQSTDRKILFEELHYLTLDGSLIPGRYTNFHESGLWYTIAEKIMLTLRQETFESQNEK